MRIARIAFAGLAALAVTTVSHVGLAKPAAAAPTGPAVGWTYSSEANAYWRSPEATPSPSNDGPLLEWTQYSGTNELSCPEADPAYSCNHEDGPGGYTSIWCNPDVMGPRGLPRFAWIRWERELEDDGTPGLWFGAAADCSEPGPDDVIEMEEIREIAYANVLEELPLPDVALKPAPTGLVNLPVIVSTDYPRPMQRGDLTIDENGQATIDVTIYRNRPPNFTGEITAWIDDYRWTFKDGGTSVGTISGRGRGRPYTPSVDPRTNPAYYVSHIYRKAGGGKTVTLNLNWVGRVVVPDVDVDGVILPVPVTMTTPEFAVQEAKPVLGDG